MHPTPATEKLVIPVPEPPDVVIVIEEFAGLISTELFIAICTCADFADWTMLVVGVKYGSPEFKKIAVTSAVM